MANSVDVGTGTGFTLSTSTLDTCELLDVQWGGISRESVPTSHMGTTGTVGGHLFMPADLADPGEVTFTVHFDPDVSPQINTIVETVTVNFLGTNAWSASGFITAFDINCPLEEKMTATITYKLTGNITVA